MASHLLLVPGPRGYALEERDGEPPAAGDRLDIGGRRFVVTKVGPSPLPADTRPCAHLQSA